MCKLNRKYTIVTNYCGGFYENLRPTCAAINNNGEKRVPAIYFYKRKKNKLTLNTFKFDRKALISPLLRRIEFIAAQKIGLKIFIKAVYYRT